MSKFSIRAWVSFDQIVRIMKQNQKHAIFWMSFKFLLMLSLEREAALQMFLKLATV